ncbi:uncharacterized protein LOC108110018 isoform X2 [Drosophila eugracilis]|nr:uncharacterized protein LOC108110018 isoform X2 [Drosophila eugracilis]
MWQPRITLIFKDKQLRRYRLIGSVLMFKAWSNLLYALLFNDPEYIELWLVFSSIAMFINMIVIVVDFIANFKTYSLRSFVPLQIPNLNMLCVIFLKSAMEWKITNHGSGIFT